MTIFHHPFTNIEKLSIVTPFEPDKFPSMSQPRITFHTRGQSRREISSQVINDQMPEAGRQIWEKMEFRKLLSSPFREIWVSKSKAKMLEREPKKMKNRKMDWKETPKKNGLKWKWREIRKEDQSKIGPSRDWKMILGLITQKHSLGLLILSSGTLNRGLHYVL